MKSENNKIFALHFPLLSASFRARIVTLNVRYTYISVGIGPLSSMGSPMTLMILPRVAGPTGILIGDPESLHTCPRTSPSVPSIAIVRTVFSPGVRGQYETREDFSIAGLDFGVQQLEY